MNHTISNAPVVWPHVDGGIVDVVQGVLRRKVLAGAGRPVLRGAVTGPGVEGDPGAALRPEALLPGGHLSGGIISDARKVHEIYIYVR